MYSCDTLKSNGKMFSFEFLLDIIFLLFKINLFVSGTHFLSIK